ncbi:unnamed protein product [Orchesella dallaii]|uniref:Uncharacterized protein n=1 Tax=Orchesella dallaii TaxID=48710 RepID=A0ABP1S2K7_9HEXA
MGVLFLFACVGYAIAGYGSGTPGYYDPWTYYGGYDRYYGYGDRRPQPRPYGERRYGNDYGSNYNQYYRYGQYGSSSNYPYSRSSYDYGYNRY